MGGDVKLTKQQQTTTTTTKKNIWYSSGASGNKSHLMRTNLGSLCGKVFYKKYENSTKEKCAICIKTQAVIADTPYHLYFRNSDHENSRVSRIKRASSSYTFTKKNIIPSGKWKIQKCKKCKKMCGYFAAGRRDHSDDICPRCGVRFD